jgi:hypothetical protein
LQDLEILKILEYTSLRDFQSTSARILENTILQELQVTLLG